MNNSDNQKKEVSISDIIENSNETKQDIFEKQTEEKIIFDINADSVEYLIKYLINKKYDFFTLEPEDDKVKVTFRKDNIEKEVKYIKYPIYQNILLKSKSLTKLDTSNNLNSQEGKTEINLNNKRYRIISKTVPSNVGERLFLKATEIEKKVTQKKKEKMSLGQIMSIFGGLSFATIIIGGVFLTVILFNSTSVSDLQFFNNLGIDTNTIKDFAAKLVNGIFGFVLFVILIFLFIFSYKAILTKKELKKQKLTRTIISIFLLILSVITLILWMFLSGKINTLRGINYGKVEFYDNSKFISKLFNPEESKIDIDNNIIGPITIRFNNSEFMQKIIDEGFIPKKTIWKINSTKIEKPAKDYKLIYEFKEKGLNNINLIIEGLNIKGEPEIKQIDLGTININNIVKINELKLDNGGSKFIFNANDLKHLGKIKWYYIPSLNGKTEEQANKIISKSLSKELLTGYNFNSKNIFEGEEYYGIKIVSGEQEKDGLDKIFIVNKGDRSEVKGKLIIKQNLENNNRYTFSFKPRNETFGESYIKKFSWEIQDYDINGDEIYKRINNIANLSDLENSSRINYTFKKAGPHKIKLRVLDSNNKEDIFTNTINISKQLELKTHLSFYNENKELKYKKNYIYDKKANIYNIDDILAPTTLKIDATKIKAYNLKYGLKEVLWDIDNDGNFEESSKTTTVKINKLGFLNFKVKYIFVNKNIKTDTVTITETINITAINKEAILDLQIIKTNSYVPVIVSFDASNSIVTGKNIDKFIYDYGDGTPPEERDAKNKGHKYTKAKDYNVKLTVITTDGYKYILNKKLVLKNKPQEAKITASLKKAPTYQAIDFSAENSIGEVENYLWDFGDGKTSDKITASHFYKKPGKYKVKLTIEFRNRNITTDEIDINIYKN